MKTTLDDYNRAFILRNRKRLEAEGITIPEVMLGPDAEKRERHCAKNEKLFQTQVENWLRLRGYYHRTDTDICAADGAYPFRGWQVHLFESRRNPILLDILLLSHCGKYTEFELKIPPIRYSGEEQKMLCVCYRYPVFTELKAVVQHVLDWENQR